MVLKGEQHYAWKGENASYSSVHKWVRTCLGSANRCDNDPEHVVPRYHWSNVDHKYRRILTDWRPLCPACHATYDRANRLRGHLSGRLKMSKTVCTNGHILTVDNIYLKKGMKSNYSYISTECRECRRNHVRKFREREAIHGR